jgi:hypothetical protein
MVVVYNLTGLEVHAHPFDTEEAAENYAEDLVS